VGSRCQNFDLPWEQRRKGTVSLFSFFSTTQANLVKNELVLGKFDVCLTTFEVAIIEKTPLNKFKWKYICIDEAHRIKNENSLLSQVVRLFKSQSRLLITGTPLQVRKVIPKPNFVRTISMNSGLC
jgi:SNF2 family DNA or RNA helicase